MPYVPVGIKESTTKNLIIEKLKFQSFLDRTIPFLYLIIIKKLLLEHNFGLKRKSEHEFEVIIFFNYRTKETLINLF